MGTNSGWGDAHVMIFTNVRFPTGSSVKSEMVTSLAVLFFQVIVVRTPAVKVSPAPGRRTSSACAHTKAGNKAARRKGTTRKRGQRQ